MMHGTYNVAVDNIVKLPFCLTQSQVMKACESSSKSRPLHICREWPSTHRPGGWLSSRAAGISVMANSYILTLSGIEIQCLFHVARHLITMLAELSRPPYKLVLPFLRVFMIKVWLCLYML